MTTRTIPRLVLIAATALASGCGPRPAVVADAAPTPIAEVGRLLRVRGEMGKPAPRTLKEAQSVPGASPLAIEALKSGAVAIYWGADLDQYAGTAVIGHEKDAPEKGGRVILGDGTVAELTADQIRDLPRPPDALLKPGGPTRTGRTR